MKVGPLVNSVGELHLYSRNSTGLKTKVNVFRGTNKNVDLLANLSIQDYENLGIIVIMMGCLTFIQNKKTVEFSDRQTIP